MTVHLNGERTSHAGSGAHLSNKKSPAPSRPDNEVCVDDDSPHLQNTPSPAKPAASDSGVSASRRQSTSQDMASLRAVPSGGALFGCPAPSCQSDVSQGSASGDAVATGKHDTGKW